MQTIGKKGELLAKQFLEEKGYEILDQNWRHKKSEIDLIAQHDGLYVFIEVKTRSQTYFGPPESFVTENQQQAILRAAQQYLLEKEWSGDIRFDVLAIHLHEGKTDIEHFKDAFY